MAFIKKIAERLAAAKSCAVQRADAVKVFALEMSSAAKDCAMERASAAKDCALGRASAAKDCALERASAAKDCAKDRMLSLDQEARMWLREKKMERDERKAMRDINKFLYRLENDAKKQDYKLKLKEYQRWRFDQAEIANRDIFKRMQKLNMIDPSLEFPLPLRPGLYDKRPSPLPPQKPFIQSYREYLRSTKQVVGLFDETVRVLFVKPARTLGTLVFAVAAGAEAYKELKSPGTIMGHLKNLGSILKSEQTVEGKDVGEESTDT